MFTHGPRRSPMLRRLATAALSAAVATTVPACTNDGSEPPPSTPSTTPASSASTPATESAQAGAAAVAAYRRYINVTDAMMASGGTDVKNLPSVAAGVELRVSQIEAENYRGRKIRAIGTTEIIWVKPVKVGGAIAGASTTATVQACLDTSKTQAVDSAGKSVRPAGTPTRWLDTRDLQLIGGGWKVVKGKNQGAQC
ncbi:hypothetical protein ACGFIF_01055 [Kribbella sp. NPDC049174]|uniref:hypothetical protein n=1 Tax=Kribbella sp. NPDC049174 TaxID=3364112 RepID=UPI0037183CF6